MVKRNYWFEFKEDFFKDDYIIALRSQKKGAECVIIYQKILSMSIKTDGKITFKKLEPTFEEELAFILNERIKNVKITLEFMKKHKLIVETDKQDVFLLPSMPSIIGSEE